MAAGPVIEIHTGTVRDPSPQEARLAEVSREIHQARGQGFTEMAWDEVEQRPRYVIAPDGSLWRRERGIPALGRTVEDFRFMVTEPLEGAVLGIIWLRRVVAPEPTTRAELDQRERERERAAEAQRAERAKQLERLRQSAEPVTVRLFDKGLPLTLRAMVERVGTLGGRIEAVGGRVVVSLPPGERGTGKLGARIATQLYRAEAELLATRKSDGPISAAKVPDRPLLPSGRVLP
jgi:hypothetical protein